MDDGGLDRIEQRAAKLPRPRFDGRRVDQESIRAVGQPVASVAKRSHSSRCRWCSPAARRTGRPASARATSGAASLEVLLIAREVQHGARHHHVGVSSETTCARSLDAKIGECRSRRQRAAQRRTCAMRVRSASLPQRRSRRAAGRRGCVRRRSRVEHTRAPSDAAAQQLIEEVDVDVAEYQESDRSWVHSPRNGLGD